MEGRHYAAILLFIFGVIEAYSYPQSLDAPGTEDVISDLTPNFEHEQEYYHLTAVEDENRDDSDSYHHREGARIKRNKPLSGIQKAKNAQEAARNLDRRVQAAARQAEEQRQRQAREQRERQERAAREQRFRNIMAGYRAQGMNQGQALMQANRDHPDLADLIFSS